LEFLNDYRSQ
jgi:hypothetical protein